MAEYNLPFMLEKAASGRERGEEISDPRLAPKNRARTWATRHPPAKSGARTRATCPDPKRGANQGHLGKFD